MAYTHILFPKEENGEWGYVNKKGEWKIQPQYHYASEFHDGLACVMKYFNHNGSIVKLYGFINRKGILVIPMVYNYASDFHRNIAVVGTLPGTHMEPTSEWKGAATSSNLMELQFINKKGSLSKITQTFHYAEFGQQDTIKLIRKDYISHTSLEAGREAWLSEEYCEFKILRSAICSSFINPYHCNDSIIDIPDNGFIENIKDINDITYSDFRWGPDKKGIVYSKTNQQLDSITEIIHGTIPSITKLIPKAHWGMWGLSDEDGNWLVPAKYDWIEERKRWNEKGFFLIHGATGWGILDYYGDEIVPLIHDNRGSCVREYDSMMYER